MPYEKKPSLAETIKAKQKALKADSKEDVSAAKDKLKSTLKEKKESAERTTLTLAGRLKAKGEAKEKEADALVKPIAKGSATLSEEDSVALKAQVDELNTRYDTLFGRVQLTDIVRDVTSLGNQIEDLPEAIEDIRRRGYIFHPYLENKVGVIAEKWDDINDKVELWMEEESEELDDDIATAKAMLLKLGVATYSAGHQDVAANLDGVLGTIDTAVGAAEERVRALYDTVQTEVSRTSSQVNKIKQYLDWTDEANFELSSGESVFMVAKGEWDDGKDKPDGFVFVTDKRIVFEQNEKTGKRFGMFGGKQTQQTLWEAPLDSVEDVVPEDKGMFGGKDMMHLKLGAGAPYAELTVEIKGGIDSKAWAKQIKRAVKGVIKDESTVEPDPELIERLKDAPTECPNCSGTLPTIDAGDTEATCQYCGTTIRI